jgi:hypothetical protein
MVNLIAVTVRKTMESGLQLIVLFVKRSSTLTDFSFVLLGLVGWTFLFVCEEEKKKMKIV